jgi:hypothetical protein
MDIFKGDWMVYSRAIGNLFPPGLKQRVNVLKPNHSASKTGERRCDGLRICDGKTVTPKRFSSRFSRRLKLNSTNQLGINLEHAAVVLL